MANEKEIREGSVRYPVCARTGARCECERGLGCRNQTWRTRVDHLPTSLVHRLRTLGVHLQVCKDDCDWALDFDEQDRVWPKPELRDIRRKLETAESLLREILK